MARKALRAVGEDEKPPEPVQPVSLLDAVASGDVLEMLLAQRRLIAEALVGATEGTRPQLNNELNKLHALIASEEARRAALDAQEAADLGVDDEAFDASAV